MNNSTGQFPNETYLNGLRDNPMSTLAVVYDEFRAPIIQAIMERGGSGTSGAAVFQLAVNDAARLGRKGALPTDVPFSLFLEALSLAHYEAGREMFDLHTELKPGNPAPEEIQTYLPGREALILSQQKVFAWANLQRLDTVCQNILMGPASADAKEVRPDEQEETITSCKESYLQVLSSETEAYAEMPDWAEVALKDRDGYEVWLRSENLEGEWRAATPAPPESNRIWRWAVGLLLLVAIGYGFYQFYFRPKTAAEVFADNFVPPASLIDDMEARYGLEMGNDSSGAQPNQCLLLIQAADHYFQANDYDAAADHLLLIVSDPDAICQSDAWFYLGIIQLKREEPTTAIQCFAKIEDLGRYGEDLYWYQALAFVQLAKENPLLREKARGAIERTLGNSRDPKRRKQAENMLKNLSQ